MDLRLNKLDKGFKQFLIKTAIFVGLFIAFSAIIGTKLYANNLLSGWKIEIYGRIGYILLFSIAGFILLYRKRLLKLKPIKNKTRDALVLFLSFLLLALFYLFEIYAYNFNINLISILLAHLLLIVTMAFLVAGIYGIDFIVYFIKSFKKELLYFLVFAIITGSLMGIVWSSWPYLSSLVLEITDFLLGILKISHVIIEPRTIIVGDFGAQIAEACSGIYSIFLFIALYLFIVFLDWKKINKKKAGLLFIPAVIGAFFINVFRVFLLFMVGAYVSKDVAMSLYHSYSGMVLFLIYFAVFWFLFYKWMKNEKSSFIPKDSLYRNSIYLMLSTFVMAVLGFVFWMICARLFTTEQVGLATTIISVMGLITTFSALGLGTGIIRFLPSSERKNDKINTCFTLNIIVTVIMTTIFLLGLHEFSPKLLFIKENMILSFIFIIFMVFASLSGLIDSIFIAYRSAKYTFLKSSIFSVLKLVFPFVLISLGAYGIFSSYMASLIIGFLAVFLILIYKFNYRPRFVFYDAIIKQIGKYSFGNYTAGFISSLPTLLLPMLILNMIGAETSAYYYMAMMIAGVLFIIPSATSNSLFAEGSYDEKNMSHQIKKAIKIISLLIIPAIIITIVLGKYVLLMFGQDYSNEGYMFLNLLAVSGVFVSINSVFASLFRVKKKITQLILISIIGAILILGLSLLFISENLGLLGIGYAWVIGQVVITAVYGFLSLFRGRGFLAVI